MLGEIIIILIAIITDTLKPYVKINICKRGCLLWIMDINSYKINCNAIYDSYNVIGTKSATVLVTEYNV